MFASTKELYIKLKKKSPSPWNVGLLPERSVCTQRLGRSSTLASITVVTLPSPGACLVDDVSFVAVARILKQELGWAKFRCACIFYLPFLSADVVAG